MPEAPITPESAPSRPPEIDQKINILWARLIETKTGTITADTRSVIAGVLGTKKAAELEKKGRESTSVMSKINPLSTSDSTMNKHGMHNILNELTQSGVGMLPHIQSKVEAIMKRDKIKSIDAFRLIDTPGTATTLGKEVRDPDSPEAKVLAWLHHQVVNTANCAHFAEIFDTVDESEVRNADALQKMQKIYQAITDEKLYVGIGLDPDEDVGGSGSGKLKVLRKKVESLEKQASDVSKVKNGNPEPFLNRAEKEEAKIEALNAKKKELGAHLTQFNTHANSLRVRDASNKLVKINPIADVIACAQDFSLAKLQTDMPGLAAAYAEVGGTTQQVDVWLTDDELSVKANQAITQFRTAGPGPVPASMALERLLRKTLGTPAGMGEEEVKMLNTEVRNRMLSGGSVEDSASKKPGFFEKMFPSAASALGITSDAAKKAASGGKKGAGGIWKYLTEKV